jgi:putative PIN family toxin of toxin-antitoxin system
LIAVLDTNVLVSGYITKTGTPGKILARWREGAFDLAVSPQLLAEFGRVLARPKFHRYLAGESPPTDELWSLALVVEPEPVSAVIVDPTDDLILGTALAAAAEVVVSGDDHLLSLGTYRGVRIITPRRFLVVLEAPDVLP